MSLTYADGAQQTGRDVAVGIPHHRLVDLHLVLAANLGVVRLDARRVGIVVVPANKTGGHDFAGAEHELILAITNREMEPGAP